MRVILRPAVAEDIRFVTDRPLPSRIQAITAEVDGTFLGIGGIAFHASGPVAFAVISKEARKYPAAIHRAGRAAMRLIERSRLPRVVAEPEPGNPAAERWLLRLGFERREIAGQVVFVWERATHVQ